MNILLEQNTNSSNLNTSKIIDIKNINSNYIILQINRPSNFHFQAGQYIPFQLYDQNGEFEYHYSIASSNKNTKFLEFCIQIIGNGRGVQFWKKLKIGDTLCFKNPTGNFIIDHLNQSVVLIAGGSGIAPIRSFIQEFFLESKENNLLPYNIHVIYGCKNAHSFPFKDELIKTSIQFNKCFKLYLSAEEEKSENIIQGNILTSLKNNQHTFEKDSIYYICGSLKMVEAVQKNLVDLYKINLNKIFKDN